MVLGSHICFIVVLSVVQLENSFALVEYDSSLLNSKTGQKFSELLIDSFTTDLLNIAKDKRQTWLTYSANDLAAVQAIQAMEKSLFDLSAYYAQNKTAVIVNKYLDGLAIEYATIRCDSVISNKFPRNLDSLPATWKDHRDHSYYDIHCHSNATNVLPSKYPSLHSNLRVRRSLRMLQPKEHFGSKSKKTSNERRTRRSVNDPKICGSKLLYTTMSGNITSPGYPGNYSAGITCIWHITVPVKYAVSISFDVLNMEYDKQCFYDSVEFFDGASVNSKSIRRVCGTTIPVGIRSSLNSITIKMKTDDTIEHSGFILKWNYTEPNYPHPGYIVVSNIVVDQLGPNPNDLAKFALVFKKPTTCPLKSNDVYCYFQYDAVIISRIISTRTLPPMLMQGKTVDIKFDHIIELKNYPTLYRSKKYCMKWNDTVAHMEIGAWSRYGGKVYRSDDFSTTCRFDEPGIYAVFAEHNFVEEAVAFRFTGTFYAGIFFSIFWLLMLISQWVFSRRINVPEWINFNQAVSLVLFLGTVLCGLHLEFVKSMCSLLAFFLYYFGLGVFFWQFLKAAQVSGKFDDFFSKGRNIYLFYFLLGWVLPIFIAGMAAGAMFSPSSHANSCWLALVGGTIWGYTSPTYFLVFGNVLIMYKVSKKTKKNLERFNHSKLRKRIMWDLLQLILFLLTWIFGVLCILNKTQFSLQFMFSLSISSSVLLMSLAAKQRRPGYQKIHYISYKEKYKQEEEEAMNNQDNRPNEEQDVFVSHTMSMKAYKRWKRFKKHELKLDKFLGGTRRGNGFDYNAYYTLDEEGSRSTLDSALAAEKYNDTIESERNSGTDSELDLGATDEEDKQSVSSAESNVETQENRATDERLSSDSASESEDTSDDDDDDLNADVDMDHDVESRNTSVYTSSQKTGRTSENRNSPEEMAGNGESEAAVDTEVYVKNEKHTVSNEENEAEGQTGDMEGECSDDDEKDEQNSQLEDKAYNDEGRETGKASAGCDEQPQSASRGSDNSDDEEKKEEEIEQNELPAITVNAFGGSPQNGESGNTLSKSPRPSSRSMRVQPSDQDVISVCSLDEEEDLDEDNSEEGHATKKDIDLFNESFA